jgi:hypothetical protein
MNKTNAGTSEPLSYAQTSLIQDLVNCALACESCYASCLREQHVDMMARCIELTRDCSELCFQGARMIMRESEFTDQMLRGCEEACRICAQECNKHEHEHCKICAEACQSCARACFEMHHSGSGTGK